MSQDREICLVRGKMIPAALPAHAGAAAPDRGVLSAAAVAAGGRGPGLQG